VRNNRPELLERVGLTLPQRRGFGPLVSPPIGEALALHQQPSALDQFRPIVLHVADVSPDFPCLDRAGMGFISAAAWSGVPNLVIEREALNCGAWLGCVVPVMLAMAAAAVGSRLT
jgi:hypothetical protein